MQQFRMLVPKYTLRSQGREKVLPQQGHPHAEECVLHIADLILLPQIGHTHSEVNASCNITGRFVTKRTSKPRKECALLYRNQEVCHN
jgi:hypothetical protein